MTAQQGSTSLDSRVQRLDCRPNNYEWGKIGTDSLAAQLSQHASGGEFTLDKAKPYAELWMGTHPNQPAHLMPERDTLLSSWLNDHPDYLGDALDKFPVPYTGEDAEGKKHVPFLFKILSCKQALPLQIHPDKDLAAKLHEENPDQFPDTNHKPEIAVCLSDRFLGFAGFRPLSVIRSFLSSTPEIQQLPPNVKDAVRRLVEAEDKEDLEVLREVWRVFLEMGGKDGVESAVRAFCARAKNDGTKAFSGVEGLEDVERKGLVEALGVLEEYNAGEAAIFTSVFFLNLMELKRGEGIYVGADGPHAWLTGDIVELMAASDNVLNVGFTPEIDSTALVARAVTCTPKSPSDILLASQPWSKGRRGNTVVYKTPFEEFSIARISGAEELAPLSGPAIAIVTDSQGTGLWDRRGGAEADEAGSGSVYFVAAGTELGVKGRGEVWMAFYDGDEASAGEVGKQ